VIRITVSNHQSRLPVDRRRFSQAVRNVLEEAQVRRAKIGVVVVDDPTIHVLNRRFLEHDYPTDVLSFPMELRPGYVEGEVVVSADTAAAQGPHYGLEAVDELAMYVIHGVLHLVGYDDHSPRKRAAMWAQQRRHLEQLGVGGKSRPKRRRKPRKRTPSQGKRTL
jgi:probable rRNA maturation factor